MCMHVHIWEQRRVVSLSLHLQWKWTLVVTQYELQYKRMPKNSKQEKKSMQDLILAFY